MKIVGTCSILLLSLFVHSQILVPRFDIYNFEVGDEFHYRLTSSDCKGNYNQGSIDNTYRITNKQYSIDSSSVTYERDRSLRKNDVTENSHEWITYSDLDSNILITDSSFIDTNYNGRYVYRIEEFGFDHYDFDYAKGLGEVYNSFYDGMGDYCQKERLVYFKKGSEEWGERLTMDIDEMDDRNSLNIYPNPAKTEFTITQDNTATSIDLKISDINGKIVCSRRNLEILNGQLKVSNLNLKQGIYFVEVMQNSNKLSSKLLIK